MLLLHIEGIATEVSNPWARVKGLVEEINQQDLLREEAGEGESEPEYKFIGIESISSWTNTGRLVVHE